MECDPDKDLEAQLLKSLIAYDEAIARGQAVDAPITPPDELPPELRERLLRSLSCLQLLRMRWPTSLSSPAEEAEMARPPSLPGYVVDGLVGYGGMGVVYKAHQTALDRTVAIKLILSGAHAGPERRRRFLQEARAMARLTDPHFVRLYEAGEVDGVPYMVLEYVAGNNLAERCMGQAQPPGEAACLIADLARAMYSAHTAQIVHRDLKPANILVAADGFPKITDFGLAKDLTFPLLATESGMTLGTIAYMAPEQVAGSKKVGPAADVYSLGAVLFELLTGMPPFGSGSRSEVLHRVLHDPPPSLRRLQPSVPRDLETICLRCLEKAPEKRYGSAAALAEDLYRFQRGEPIRARPISVAGHFWRLCRRHPGVSSAIFAACLLLSIVTGIYVIGLRGAIRQAEDHLHFQTILVADREWQNGRVDRAERMLQGMSDRSKSTWEWRYLSQRHRSFLGEFTLGKAAIECVALSRDGSLLAAGIGQRLCVWDTQQNRIVLDQIPGQWVTQSLAFDPSGRRLASAAGTDLFLWDLPEGVCRAQLPGQGHSIRQVLFSPDGFQLATTDVRGGVIVWRIEDGAILHRFDSGGVEPRACYSPDGRFLALAWDSRAPSLIQIRDARSGSTVHKLSTDRVVTSLSFSPDGSLLAVADAARDDRLPGSAMIALWDVATGRVTARIPQRVHQITHMEHSPTGGELFALGTDSVVRAWDVQAREEKRIFRDDAIKRFALGQNGHRLAVVTASGFIRLWDSSEQQQGTKTLRTSAKLPRALAFHPNGKLLAAGGSDGMITLWELPQGRQVHAWMAHRGRERGVTSVAFLPNGTQLASAGEDKVVRLWDAFTGNPSASLSGHEDWVESLAASPDGRWLASGSHDGMIMIWDASTGTARQAFRGHEHRIRSLAFSPDGRLLASGAVNCTVHLWDVATWECKVELETSLQDDSNRRSGESLTFSACGRYLYAADGTPAVQIFDLGKGKRIRFLEGHTLKVSSLSMSPDGLRLVTGSDDRALRLWNSASGREILTLSGHPGGVECVAFSPDGCRIASGGWDGTVRIWEAPSPIKGHRAK